MTVSPDPVRAVPDSARRLAVCTRCFDLRGPVGSARVQRCRCRDDAGHASDDRWAGKDFNREWELCRCCGVELLVSGSRWSVWFCTSCKEHVLAFNRSVGRSVIPVGRHSLMAGVGLGGPAVDVPEQVAAFADRLGGFFDAVGFLDDVATAAVADRVDALGFDAAARDISLVDFVAAAGVATVDTGAAFARLVERVIASPRRGRG